MRSKSPPPMALVPSLLSHMQVFPCCFPDMVALQAHWGHGYAQGLPELQSCQPPCLSVWC